MFYLSLTLLFTLSLSKVHFHEQFDKGFEQRWVYSEDKSVSHGSFDLIQKTYCPEGDLAIKSINDSSYYHISSKFSEPLDTTKSAMFLQYVAHYEQPIACGGAYLKVFSNLDQKSLTGTSDYNIMFGPDVCGYGTRVIHLIIGHKGKYYPLKEKESFELDTLPHLIQLYIGADKTFSLKLDGAVRREGKLEDHFDFLPSKFINDPTDKKPEDWDERETIVNPEDKKPEDWDDRQDIPDPEAKKPEDWDDSVDGEWEQDLIKNPNFKGLWAPKQIPNSNYKGVWAPKQISNPEYHPDNTFANFMSTHVGFDLWTVESGTSFDDIFITDSQSESDKHAKEVSERLAIQKEQIKEKMAKDKKDKPETPLPEESPD
ncbi:hypothetical protein HZS_7667, partial [Henneguya salminicola]